MCRVVNVFHARCPHPQLIEITGWCKRRAPAPRRKSASCRSKELFVLDTFCHACAVRQMNQYVDQMRNQLREYWKPATHVRRHLVHTRHRLDAACSHAVTPLSRTFHQFVATDHHRCRTEFKVWMNEFRRDPMAEGAPLPRPRLPCLHWPDPQVWIDRAKARANASLATRRLVDDDRGDSGDEDDHFSVVLYGCLHDHVVPEDELEDDG
ncbi:MAG: hypothetical protein M1826_001109 [Phylliscum demangeonii]|nr:MAG: hypothetical protein M1826_001109 [Phylliscum demangeonii]